MHALRTRPLAALLLPVVLVTAGVSAAQAGPEPGSREVTYGSDGLTLAATLLTPPGPGPFPGVVIVHGSGTSSRSNPWTDAYATALVQRGVAVLHPDKRGSGDSEGDWRSATFEDLAADAIAGVELLRGQPEVDAARVGVIGFSQGGDIVPIAAATSSDVAFVIDVSGSVVPILEQIGDEIRKMGEREGLTPEQLRQVARIHELGGHYALTGEGWDAYLEALEQARNGAVGSSEAVSGFPTDPDSGAWDFLGTIGGFDPMPYWQRVTVPTLFLYGGRDENVDVAKSADLIQRRLAPTDLPYSLLLFRNNGHALFRDDAMDFIGRWVRDGGVD